MISHASGQGGLRKRTRGPKPGKFGPWTISLFTPAPASTTSGMASVATPVISFSTAAFTEDEAVVVVARDFLGTISWNFVGVGRARGSGRSPFGD